MTKTAGQHTFPFYLHCLIQPTLLTAPKPRHDVQTPTPQRKEKQNKMGEKVTDNTSPRCAISWDDPLLNGPMVRGVRHPVDASGLQLFCSGKTPRWIKLPSPGCYYLSDKWPEAECLSAFPKKIALRLESQGGLDSVL